MSFIKKAFNSTRRLFHSRARQYKDAIAVNAGKQSILHGKDDLPSLKHFVDEHYDRHFKGLDCTHMVTTDPATLKIGEDILDQHAKRNNVDPSYFKDLFMSLPQKHTQECGSRKILMSDIEDFPEYKQIYEKTSHENRLLCIGGPAAEDQVVIAQMIDTLRNKLDKITYLTKEYKESNVQHSAKHLHARHGNALNGDPTYTGHTLIKTFLLRMLKVPEDILDPEYKKIHLKYEFDLKKLRIYLGNEFNWLKQLVIKKYLGQLNEHDVNRMISVASQEIIYAVENQTNLHLCSRSKREYEDSINLRVVFNKKTLHELIKENEDFKAADIYPKEIPKEDLNYFFPHQNGSILTAIKFPGDAHIKFDDHLKNREYASKNNIDWIEGDEVKNLLVKKNEKGVPEVVGVATIDGKFIQANKIHMTGGYKVDYKFDQGSKTRFTSTFIRNSLNRLQDAMGMQNPLNSNITIATGNSINFLFKNTPEMKDILKKYHGFEYSALSSHWTPIAWNDDYMVVRGTAGGNTGSEEYNPTYFLNVLSNTRRIFGDTPIGILTSYGCSRAVNAKNSTEFAKVAEGLVISYGKGGTGNTKRHAEAVFALMELGYADDLIKYFNQFKSEKGTPVGEEIKRLYGISKRMNFFHDNVGKSARRMGYSSLIGTKELTAMILVSFVMISLGSQLYH